MRVLTLTNPHAALLVRGHYTVTCRSQPKALGKWAISASKKWSRLMAAECRSGPMAAMLEDAGLQSGIRRHCTFPFKMIVGEMEIVACVPTAKVLFDAGAMARMTHGNALIATRHDYHMNDFKESGFALLCKNAWVYPNPVPHRGGMRDSLIADRLLPGRHYLTPVPIGRSIGERIESLRTQMGINLRRLAKVISTSFGYLSSLESGSRPVTEDMAERIAVGLNVEPEVLYPPE